MTGEQNYHPSIGGLLRWLDDSHLPQYLKEVVKPFRELGYKVANELTGPEAAVSIRRLVEAKDCAVRARVAQADAEVAPPKAMG